MIVVTETDAAIGLGSTLGEVEIWLPKRQLEDPPEIGDELSELVMPRWLADDKGLPYEED